MKSLLLVSLLTLAAAAQNPPLQKGVSVQMAGTSSAQPMPAADQPDAWIITVTDNGQIWFGINPVTADSLTNEMMRIPRNRDEELYVKADARVPFAIVETVLKSALQLQFASVILLTRQTESSAPENIVRPKGLRLWLDAKTASTAIKIEPSSQGPVFSMKGQEIPPSELKQALRQHLSNNAGAAVTIESDAQVPYSAVIEVVDACSSAGASAWIVLPPQ